LKQQQQQRKSQRAPQWKEVKAAVSAVDQASSEASSIINEQGVKQTSAVRSQYHRYRWQAHPGVVILSKKYIVSSHHDET
jgi:hypothetical protein